MSGEARLDILTRIARADTKPAALDRPSVARSSRAHARIVEQFAEFAAEYKANVVRADAASVPRVVGELLTRRRSGRVVVPTDLPFDIQADRRTVTRDANFDAHTLAEFDAVVTLCAVAIAETGTVVLDHGVGQGRRALTLVPDHHVCVVRASQVVDRVPEAVERLEVSVLAGRPLTWISGPSATSDIELSRVEGVHGPRVLDLVLVREG